MCLSSARSVDAADLLGLRRGLRLGSVLLLGRVAGRSLDAILEAFKTFAKTLAELGQLARAEDQQGDDQNDDEMRGCKQVIEHGVVSRNPAVLKPCRKANILFAALIVAQGGSGMHCARSDSVFLLSIRAEKREWICAWRDRRPICHVSLNHSGEISRAILRLEEPVPARARFVEVVSVEGRGEDCVHSGGGCFAALLTE